MKRRLASLAQPMATCLALVLLLLFPASCSKDQVPVAPERVVTGSKSAPSPSGQVIPDQGILTFQSGFTQQGTFLSSNDLVLMNVLIMPAAGTYDPVWYYLVRTEDGSDFADKAQSFQATAVSWWSENQVLQHSDDDVVAPDRDGLTFDDHHTASDATEYASQPAFTQVDLAGARNVSEGNDQTVIAIMDTGVDASHPLFQSPQAKFTHSGNYTTWPITGGNFDNATSLADDDGDGYANDGVGHGTHVAGIVYTGARQAKIRIYKVLDDEGRGTIFGLAKAMRVAVTSGVVDVISCSLGFLDIDPEDGYDGNRMVHHAVQDAAAQGMAIVASAGNLNSTTKQYPAAYDEVISVTAVDDEDVKAVFASHGPEVDIAAPGEAIVSAISSFWGPAKYAKVHGTSAAVPWVSAAIAVVLSRPGGPTTAADAATIVLETADDISAQNPGIQLGSGRLNMGAAAAYPLQ